MSCAGGSSPGSGCASHQRLSNVNHIDLVRGQITSSSSSGGMITGSAANNSSKLLSQSVTVNYSQKPTPEHQNQRQRLSLVDVCNHHASQSHITLSSHFEENNWDYNFATRGLYLSQPWVRGRQQAQISLILKRITSILNELIKLSRYTHTLGSESMAATSGVLTLDPTTELSLELNRPTATTANGARFIDIYGETGGSDTDGYYA